MDVQDLPAASRFAVYSDHQNHIWALGLKQNIPVSLGAGSSDMFTVVPIQQRGQLSFAAIGLTNMLNTNGAILDADFSEGSHGRGSVHIKVRKHSFNCWLHQKPVLIVPGPEIISNITNGLFIFIDEDQFLMSLQV